MGTLMADKIAEAFEEWKEKSAEDKNRKEPQVNKEPKAEAKPELRPAPKSRATGLSQQLLDYIAAHPGVTGRDLRHIIKDLSPTTPISYVPAVLKGLSDRQQVRREEVPNAEGVYGRSTYAYYVLTDAERQALTPQKKKRGPYKPRKLKAEAVERGTNGAGITSLVPSKRHATHALDVGPTTLSIAITANGKSYTMTLADAKFLYKQLNQIFGGVR